MILTAVAIVTNLDVNFDQFVANDIPDVNLTAAPGVLAHGHQPPARDHRPQGPVRRRQRLLSCGGSGSTAQLPRPANASQASLLADARTLPDARHGARIHRNRGLVQHARQPAADARLAAGPRGAGRLLDLHLHQLHPHAALPEGLGRRPTATTGLTIVGVETPEFAFEHDAANVPDAIQQFGIHYPVVQDNNMGTWNAYGNEYWPADYLIDANGQVRYATFGEGDYRKTETAIRALLAEAGHQVGGTSHPTGVVVPSEEATPETYLGTAAPQGWINGPVAGLHDYGPPPASPPR